MGMYCRPDGAARRSLSRRLLWRALPIQRPAGLARELHLAGGDRLPPHPHWQKAGLCRRATGDRMNRPLQILFVFFAGLIALCALSTALASSTAAAAASAALLTTQCTNAFVVLIAVLGGLGIGIGLTNFRNGRCQQDGPPHSFPPSAWDSPILLPPADEDDDALTQALISIIQQERR